MTAKTVVDVILGEAEAGSYEDMLAIASVIANRATSARRFKAERIGKLLDFADLKSAGYNQSGMVNALRSEASILYKQIINGKARGFSAQEIATIRKLAAVENSTEATKWLARFSPRSIMSLSLGSGAIGGGAGAMVGGPAGAVVGAGIGGAVGAGAAKIVDKAALNAAKGLQGKILRGPNFRMPPKIDRITKSAEKLMVPMGLLGGQATNR